MRDHIRIKLEESPDSNGSRGKSLAELIVDGSTYFSSGVHGPEATY